MDIRYRNYRRRKFYEWKDKIKQMLPELVIEFYNKKGYIDYSKHILLGRVITNINNPYYSVQDERMNDLDETSELTSIIILEMQVEDLIKFIKTNP